MSFYCFYIFIILISNNIVLSKVYEIYDQSHYNDWMQDLPVGSRYASIISFYNKTSECLRSFNDLQFNQKYLPDRTHLFLGKFEMSNFNQRIWHKIEDHMDFAENIGINKYINSKDNCECPIIVYIPGKYNDKIGDDYVRVPSNNGIKIWDSNKISNWRQFAWKNLRRKIKIITDVPFNFEITIKHSNSNPYVYRKGKRKKSHIDADEVIIVDSIQSHTIITAYLGDTIFVSKNPDLTDELQKEKGTQNGNTFDNPRYIVYEGLDKLYAKEMPDSEGKIIYGFDGYKRNDEIITDAFVKSRHGVTYMTHTRNLIIPLILPNWHNLGFEKRPMPPGLHERLINYYKRWYHKRKEESWDKYGTQLNFFDVRSHMISLDEDWKERDSIAKDVVRPILSEWGGVEELELTAFYGIREYSRNACLRNHVDRVDTHVFSAILQISQTDMDEPWPLEVIGFDGNRYRITLKPGEMILYEGTKLIHGRPEPLNGTRFANAFVHFKPKGYKWNGNKVWQSKKAKDMFRLLGMNSLNDIYKE